MGRYGEAAVKAVRLIQDNTYNSPREAWAQAVLEVFPDSRSMQEKPCPKGTFLGLCEAGVVKGVEPGNYTRSVKNKRYALRGLEILRKTSDLAADPRGLWEVVMGSEIKKYNQQMDVLCTLWNKGLLRR